ncbi:uncharacterized protein LOC108151010 [Drosophila miranda]|uniref:uncharacterized protein LOC108151010 n=1 Tax=Drosophila miranda TaxID=7229 RepID=UPI0007E7D659|nr:uncharacterized protein LOC108151010 [Drosophila miranda]
MKVLDCKCFTFIAYFLAAVCDGTPSSYRTSGSAMNDCRSPPEVDSAFCVSLPAGNYKYPYDCSAYISCTESCAELENCPPGKLFNNFLRICDTPEAVDCTASPYPAPQADPCVGQPNHTLLPSDSACNEFIVCVDEHSKVDQCPGQLLFNPDLRICDYPNEVWCYGDHSTQVVPEATMTTQGLFTECVGQALGTCFPYLKNCQQYYYCFGNNSFTILPCPNDNWYNPYSGHCGPEVSSEACREVTTSTGPITIPRSTPDYKDYLCADQVLGVAFPLESDCQQYVLCMGNDQWTTAKCPVNAWFDPKTGDCGPNVSPTACRDTFTTSPTVQTTQNWDDLCADQNLGFSYPLVTNCQQYILCMGDGSYSIANCIYNAWYDPQTGNCGPDVAPTACTENGIATGSTASQSNTHSTTWSTSFTTIQTPDTTTSVPVDSEICSGQSKGHYASYPEDCRKYIVCVSPVPIAFYCMEGYYFNEALQKCVDFQLSDCPKGETTTLSPSYTTPTPSPTVCLNNAGNTVPFPDNCQWFLRCVDDLVYMMGVCGSGEFFDPLTGQCGSDVSPEACRWDYDSTTLGLGTTDDPTTLSTPSTPTTEAIDPCEGMPDGKLVPYPSDCSKFIKCVRPLPIVYDCADGQEFSAFLERCMAPWVANCTIPATTTPLPFSPTTDGTPAPDSFCAYQAEGSLVPYPGNCSKYIVCQDPIPVGYACADGEEFSPTDLACMEPRLACCSPNNLVFLSNMNKNPNTLIWESLEAIAMFFW